MSLLNEALRKKTAERNQPEQRMFSQKNSGVLSNRRIIIYTMVLVLVLTIGALGAIKIFYYPFSSVSLVKTDRARVQKKISVRTTKLSAPITTVKKNKVLTDVREPVKVAVLANKAIEPTMTPKGPLMNEQKKKPAKNLSQPIKPFSSENQKISKERKIKNKSSLKKATQKQFDHNSVDAFFQKALIYHRQNKFSEAIRMYREVLKKNPQHFDARFNLAAVHIKEESFTEAKRLLEQLRRMEPNSPKILIHLAITEIGQGRPKSSLSYLRMADNTKKENQFEIYFHRGVSYSHLNDTDKAIAWYKRAEKLQPDHSRLLFNIAIVYDKIKNYPNAIKYYSEYLQHDISLDEKRKGENRLMVIKAYQADQQRARIE